MSIFDLKDPSWDIPELRTALEKVLPQEKSFQDIEVTFNFPTQKQKVLVFNGRQLVESKGEEDLILLTIEDITSHKLLQERNDTFVSMASHELKTPVTTVKTLVQILQKRFEGSEDTMLIEYLARMGQQIDQLTNLVSNLLDISKIKAGKFEVDEGLFTIDGPVKEIVEIYQLLSPNHTILLRGTTHAKVKASREHIGQVLINLMVNAIKYSPSANEIIITLKETPTEVIVSVKDFGIGIDKSNQARIFERFFQVKNKIGQNFSGLGMGLYIAAAIVERYRGRLWVESNGKGSTFFFSLPISGKQKKK